MHAATTVSSYTTTEHYHRTFATLWQLLALALEGVQQLGGCRPQAEQRVVTCVW